MRIGVDARLMQHQPAGISNYTRHLLQGLQQIDSDNEYVVFQHRRQPEPLIKKTNFQRATLYAPVHSRLEQWMLPFELRRHHLDLIHFTDFIPPLRSKIPSVITVHDLAFLHWPHFLTTESAAYYGQIDRAVRHARHVIVPSEQTKHDLTARLGVPDAHISVIYEAAAPEFHPMPIEESRKAVQEKFKLPERFIFFVGTIEPRKNVSGLLQAFAYLRQHYNVNGSLEDVGLAIAGGKGWLYEDTMAQIERLKLGNHVYILGRVEDEWLPKLYSAARCHVHVALYEGFGLPPLESMACGTPTIVSNVSSLPEVVGDAALLVSPRSSEEIAVAMQRLLCDDTLHAEMREAGLRRAKIFSWTIAAKRTLEVYKQVFSGKPTESPQAEMIAK